MAYKIAGSDKGDKSNAIVGAQSEERDDVAVSLQSLIETHELPFIVINKQLRVIAANTAFEQQFAMDREAVIGAEAHKLLQCEEDEMTGARHRRVLEELTASTGIYNFCRSDGSQRPVRVKSFPLLLANNQVNIGEMLQPLYGTVNTSEPKMIGRSEHYLNFVSQLEQAAESDIPILLEGETGTGKELASSFVHTHSPRSSAAMVTVDCTVLGEDLFESELFGHEKGAFTGAGGRKAGLFELADGGTLFLDEIGEMPLGLQSKLLRALETGEFRRVGGTTLRAADVRVVCATNRSLLDMVQEGGFRRDLYYRIAACPIRLPPLRERQEDIPLLAENILNQITRSTHREYRLTKAALVKLLCYHYPGNIRELRNILQLAATLSPEGEIAEDAIRVVVLPKTAADDIAADEDADGDVDDVIDDANLSPLEAMEARYIHQLLIQHNGRRAAVARVIGVSERTLYRKLKRYALNG